MRPRIKSQLCLRFFVARGGAETLTRPDASCSVVAAGEAVDKLGMPIMAERKLGSVVVRMAMPPRSDATTKHAGGVCNSARFLSQTETLSRIRLLAERVIVVNILLTLRLDSAGILEWRQYPLLSRALN